MTGWKARSLIPEIIGCIFISGIIAGGYWVIQDSWTSENQKVKSLDCPSLKDYLILNIDVKGKLFIDGNYDMAKDLYDLKDCENNAVLNNTSSVANNEATD